MATLAAEGSTVSTREHTATTNLTYTAGDLLVVSVPFEFNQTSSSQQLDPDSIWVTVAWGGIPGCPAYSYPERCQDKLCFFSCQTALVNQLQQFAVDVADGFGFVVEQHRMRVMVRGHVHAACMCVVGHLAPGSLF